jgi:NitT/TauT family transport system permease protein
VASAVPSTSFACRASITRSALRARGLLLWELVSRVIVANALFLAAPSQIFAAIVALARTGELWRHMWISAVEFALVRHREPAGRGDRVAMAESPVAKRVLQPGSRASTPRRPLRSRCCSFWLGIGIWSKVLVVIFLVLFP